jgi:predicted transcriptional regulator
MTKLTTTLPDDILNRLNEQAKRLSVSPDSMIEKALRSFLDELKKAEYASSFKKASTDSDVVRIAEEGMDDYFKQLNSVVTFSDTKHQL